MLFILGIERSATTWVANLLEAHPATRVYVEPMSIYTSRFKQWPDRFQEITETEEKARYFISEFLILKQHKEWLLTKWFENRYAWQFDLWFSNFLVRKKIATEAARDFSEINFHRKTQLSVSKSDKIELEVLKELRLNFNAHIIDEIDANATILIVVRNLFANIQSILKHIHQGGLTELKLLLVRYYGVINEKSVYKYWRDSYNHLLEKLSQSSAEYLILQHTQLIKYPEQQVQKLCDIAGLSNSAPILNYLTNSNRNGVGIHNTNRNHADILKRNKRVKEEVWPKIQTIYDNSNLHPKLQQIIKEQEL
jgi:hypothetical protein